MFMNLIRFFKVVFIRFLRKANELIANAYLYKYYKAKANFFEDEIKFNDDYCELVTIAFNNPQVIKYQIKCLKKFFSYPFIYTVFDNSTDTLKSEEIQSICKNENVGYVLLPKQNKYQRKDVSYSHGIAINWVYLNFIKKRKHKYFAILDHDIFPIKMFDIQNYLKGQPFYGLLLHNHKSRFVKKDIFFLWAGFSFFCTEQVVNLPLDFRPNWKYNADTGSRNYNCLYRFYDINKIERCRDKKIFFDNKNDFWNNGAALFDCGWLHMWNGSNYSNSQNWEQKLENVCTMLDEHL